MTIRYELDADQDDTTPVRGNAMASGDDAADKDAEDEILSRLDSGDVWAWAIVTVRAILTTEEGETYEGSDTLGACTYRDAEDFKAGGYYEDMQDAALADLRATMRDAKRRGEIAARALGR